MKVYQPKEATPELVSALERLLPQLDTSVEILTFKELDSLINDENTCFFVGEKDGQIMATISIVIYKIPTGEKAWIEDVIVDESVRGFGYGKKLMNFAIDFLRNKGISKVNLTSNPSRVAANKLYQSLGFKIRETNLYRMEIQK
ncbi:MAG: GNAT family N-acetyltransferase [Porphyromonadaceae bacterium]|nr:GNAT family N-acetyltransferase [Porphyromonadaceae bacterium]